MEPLAALPGLLKVDLECCFGLTGDLAPLCGLKKLEVLNVCDTNLEGATTVAAFQAAKEGVACAVGRYGDEQTPLWGGELRARAHDADAAGRGAAGGGGGGRGRGGGSGGGGSEGRGEGGEEDGGCGWVGMGSWFRRYG